MTSRLSNAESIQRLLMLRLMLPLMLLFTGTPALAEGFSVLVSPPRFTLRGDPGEVLRDYVEINNPGNQPVTFLLRTADWDMTETGATTFYPPELRPGSCRPWSRIERHKIRIPAKATKRYRFQIDIPADAQPGECRLALLIESPPEDAVITRANTVSIPVQGRLAVVIYVDVGGARADLVLQDIVIEEVNGQRAPVAILSNQGRAHGRTSGFVDGTDATGQTLEFQVSPLPILPGQTRRVPLQRALLDDETPPPFTPPLELKGTIEWEDGKLPVAQRVE
jgi:hypothetical protein